MKKRNFLIVALSLLFVLVAVIIAIIMIDNKKGSIDLPTASTNTPTPKLTSTPTPEPTSTPTPKPTSTPTPEPTSSPTPEPTSTPTPVPTSTPTPEPTSTPTPEPTSTPTPEPTSTPTPEPTSTPTPKPTSTPTPVPTNTPTPKPTSTPTPELDVIIGKDYRSDDLDFTETEYLDNLTGDWYEEQYYMASLFKYVERIDDYNGKPCYQLGTIYVKRGKTRDELNDYVSEIVGLYHAIGGELARNHYNIHMEEYPGKLYPSIGKGYLSDDWYPLQDNGKEEKLYHLFYQIVDIKYNIYYTNELFVKYFVEVVD